jgi:type IV secretion system protein VirB9
MKWALVVAAVLVGTGLQALAAVTPAPGRLDARVREVEYREGEVVRLEAYVGYHIHLELEAGERFVALGAGDSAAVDIAAEGRHVMLKPKAARVATNLTLVSSRRVYHFEYRTYEAQPPMRAAIFALRFRYPEAREEVTPAAPLPFSSVSVPMVDPDPEPEPIASLASDPVVPRNEDYWYCGSPWLRPVAVSDDGVQTRITFDVRGEWPAMFVRNADGTESLLNFHAEGTTAVVHRVAPAFVLRRGRLVGCVENRGYAGSGRWVDSGTSDPTFKREVAR